MITHEEARALVNWKKGSKLFDYISQQERKDELFGLYREKSDFLVHIMNGNKGLQENYIKLLSRIGDLEKELREMK